MHNYFNLQLIVCYGNP